jgi:hypothetical protein
MSPLVDVCTLMRCPFISFHMALYVPLASSGPCGDAPQDNRFHSREYCCRPNTHLQTWRSLQPTWCVLGGTNLNPDPLSPQSGFLPSRLTPREAKGGRPY